jgi:hypothetical protein
MGKSGFKSTEFWLSTVGMIGGIIIAAMGDNQIAQAIGAVLSVVCGASYTAGRSLIKGKEAIGAAQVQAARELAKKPEAPESKD